MGVRAPAAALERSRVAWRPSLLPARDRRLALYDNPRYDSNDRGKVGPGLNLQRVMVPRLQFKAAKDKPETLEGTFPEPARGFFDNTG
jgi:hypothetical protein